MDVSYARKLKVLEQENAQLQKPLAKQLLNVARLKEMWQKASDARRAALTWAAPRKNLSQRTISWHVKAFG